MLAFKKKKNKNMYRNIFSKLYIPRSATLIAMRKFYPSEDPWRFES